MIRRHNSHVGVLFIDIDDFKTVNDSLGHAAGDELLIAISSRIADCLRPEDTVARLGGDEFAILVDPIVSQETAREVAERTMRALERPFRIGDHDVFARASIGIAVGRGSESSADAVLADADLAMYAAKTGGKNRYEIFDPRMRDAAMRRMELNSDLRTAIERGEFFMLYQPIVDLKDGRVVGAEALVRWDHPTRGVVGPERFLPLAEETGFIVPLGRWVFERAAMQAVEWTAHDPDFVISINVSPRQFREARSIEGIEAALAMSDLEPHSLIIEITESMMLDDSDGAARQLEGMRALGVRIAVDDFGTGYSSLGRLGRLPVDILKIDRSFVSGVDTSAEDSAVARAIVRLAEIWGLSVTAEGIETESQRDELLSMGCQRGQGFWYSQPITAPELTELIARGPRAALRAVAG